jgi:hypothetical protein
MISQPLIDGLVALLIDLLWRNEGENIYLENSTPLPPLGGKYTRVFERITVCLYCAAPFR